MEIPAALQHKAVGVIQSLSAQTDPVKWIEPQKLHITVKFLGDVEDAEIYQVCQLASGAVADLPAFRAACRGVGAFPSSDRPRTIWIGVDDPTGHFQQLHQRVEQAMASLRFPREVRRFSPHLTLGRVRQGKRTGVGLTERIRQQGAVELGEFDVDELVVFSSELTPEGPVYTVLGRAPLA